MMPMTVTLVRPFPSAFAIETGIGAKTPLFSTKPGNSSGAGGPKSFPVIGIESTTTSVESAFIASTTAWSLSYPVARYWNFHFVVARNVGSIS